MMTLMILATSLVAASLSTYAIMMTMYQVDVTFTPKADRLPKTKSVRSIVDEDLLMEDKLRG